MDLEISSSRSNCASRDRSRFFSAVVRQSCWSAGFTKSQETRPFLVKGGSSVFAGRVPCIVYSYIFFVFSRTRSLVVVSSLCCWLLTGLLHFYPLATLEASSLLESYRALATFLFFWMTMTRGQGIRNNGVSSKKIRDMRSRSFMNKTYGLSEKT